MNKSKNFSGHPGGQPECHRDPDLGQPDHPAHNAGHTEKGTEEMGVFEHGVRNKLPPDDLHRPVQVPERPGLKI